VEDLKRILFVLFHFVPIFLEFIGIVPTIYFFIKIKSIYYRFFLVLKYLVIFFLMFLSIEELDNIFFQNLIIEEYNIGMWEICGLLIVLCFIIGDCFAYYFYSHNKIVVSDTKGKLLCLIAFLAKDAKIYRSTLKFLLGLAICFIIFMELVLTRSSLILDYVADFLRNK
jgi:hypothetical protein